MAARRSYDINMASTVVLGIDDTDLAKTAIVASRSNIDCATARPDHAHRMHISSVSHPSAITPNLPDQALLP